MEFVCIGAFVLFVWSLVVGASKNSEKARAKKEAEARSRPRRAPRHGDGNVVSDFTIEVSYGGLRELLGAPRSSRDCWVPPGVSKSAGKRAIPGGMVYVGTNLPSIRSKRQLEPALIDPALPRRDGAPDYRGESMGYWPGFSTITPAARSAYLDWLEGGRRDPGADIGYVFLFFYGLERRALFDLKESPEARPELPAIQAEVEALLEVYTDNGSFRRYATSFLEVLWFLASDPESQPPPLGYRRGSEVPLDIRYRVGSMVGAPMPGWLAFAWATSDPEIHLRTPARRCRDEFRELFLHRYEARFGAGFKIPSCKRTLRAQYQPASPSFLGAYTIPTEVPDVTALVAPRRKLNELVEEVTTALEPYSRKMGRDPAKRDPLAASALLPPELLETQAPKEVRSLVADLRARLAAEAVVVMTAGDVLGPWLPVDGKRQAKKEAVASVSMLAHSGIGVMPDVRFGGSKVTRADKVAIFRVKPEDPEAPSSAYAAAALILHLATMVAVSDGSVSLEEERQLQEHVTRALHLGDGERRRLSAHIALLLAAPPGMAGVKKRVEALGLEQRQTIGAFLVQVAAADGHIDPAEVKTLTKLFRVLGLDPGSVHTELHTLQAGAPNADAPVVVRPAEAGPPGAPIPAPPQPAEVSPASSSVDEPEPVGATLDMSLIQAKLQESASVSALLSSIFAEDEEQAEPEESVGDGPLDGAHMGLLRDLVARGEWSRDEFEELAERHGLLPDGALDTINELAWDTCDEALAEDGDPLVINLEVCRELLSS